MAVLLDHGDDDEVIRAFTQSDGLCLPHLASLIDCGASHVHLPAVLAAQQECLQRLHGDLKTFIRKQDYRFAHEPYGEEADALAPGCGLPGGTMVWARRRLTHFI